MTQAHDEVVTGLDAYFSKRPRENGKTGYSWRVRVNSDEDLTGRLVEVKRRGKDPSVVRLTERLFAAEGDKPALYRFVDPEGRPERPKSTASGWVSPPAQDEEYVQALLRDHPYERDEKYGRGRIYDDAGKRRGEDGLTYTATVYWGEDPDHVVVSERSETFVAEFLPRSPRGRGGVFVAPGSRAYLWRSEHLLSRGYSDSDRDHVSINGFGNGGHQSLRCQSDEEAQREVAVVRSEDGSVMAATSDPAYDQASERYSWMMSR
jgi:hypothetical protein